MKLAEIINMIEEKLDKEGEYGEEAINFSTLQDGDGHDNGILVETSIDGETVHSMFRIIVKQVY